MILDLHTHSTASDGQYTPAELIDMAKKRELVIFAITDKRFEGGKAACKGT